MLKYKLLLIAIFAILIIASTFWLGSRYPALNEKAMMGDARAIDPLGFDTLIPIKQSDPVFTKIIYTTINWSDTNKKGMTFGILFAASILTLLSLLSHKSFKGSFSNTLLGFVIGTPLGVCVNCAAPIAKGMHSGGTRLETTLAALISSPTMNVIVLTMLFSLFPLYIGIIKFSATLLFILIGLPILSKLFFKKEIKENLSLQNSITNPDSSFIPSQNSHLNDLDAINSSWYSSLKWYIKNFTKNLWFIIRKTVPLMILAGFLGSVAVTFLPWESIINIFNSNGFITTLIFMAIIGTIGIFLPVPIAFDIIIVLILFNAGLPVKFAMILLFTLGVFSIYSFFIVTQTVSFKVAGIVTVSLIFLGIFSGGVAHVYAKQDNKNTFDQIVSSLSNSIPKKNLYSIKPDKPGLPLSNFSKEIEKQKVDFTPTSVKANNKISIEHVDLNQRISVSDTLFKRYSGNKIGIERKFHTTPLNILSAFSFFKSISSGDIHNDGWTDILLCDETGLSLYTNIKGEFIKQKIAVNLIEDFHIVNGVLVDINNDEWLDIYFSTYKNGNYIIYNSQGGFDQSKLVTVPNQPDAVMTSAPAFADLDNDNDLDILLGNWGIGRYSQPSLMPYHKNAWVENLNGNFKLHILNNPDGETLSTFITDLNNDGNKDLIIGNDFDYPDLFYKGSRDGNFVLLDAKKNFIPYTTNTTMSITSADIDNNLIPEIFTVQISNNNEGQIIKDVCDEFDDPLLREECYRSNNFMNIVRDGFRQIDITAGNAFTNKNSKQKYVATFATHFYRNLFKGNEYNIAELLNNYSPELSWLISIQQNLDSYQQLDDSYLQQHITQIRDNNVLLMLKNNSYQDVAKEFNIHKTEWTWNAKFADLDSDTWQDLYVVNGLYSKFHKTKEYNIFYKNNNGNIFEDKTFYSGLDSYRTAGAYTYIDVDNDGDLDIIVLPHVGPLIYFENQSTKNNSIILELRDQIGNRFGIGSKIIIYYGDDNSKYQMREIFASGGFSSFDAPIVHFGLGRFENINMIEIVWSDGEKTQINKTFEAGKRYKIQRKL